MTAVVSDYTARLENVNKTLKTIADRTTPLLSRHLDLKNPATAIKHEWVDKPLVGMRDSLKAALTSSTTTVMTLSGGTDNPKRIIDGVSTLLVGSEYLLVNSTITVVTNSQTLNVSRAQLSSTASSHAVNSEVRILSSRVEGFTADRDDSQKGVRQYNLTMIVERQLELSGSSQAVDNVGKEQRMKQQRRDLMPEWMKDLELELLYSPRSENADLTSRTAGGFQWHAVNRGAMNKSMGGNKPTFNDFDDIVETYLKNGGDANNITLLTSIQQQRNINELKMERIESGGMTQAEMGLNNFVEFYKFGSKARIKILFHTDVMNDEMYFYDASKVKVIPLQGRQLKREPLAKNSDTDREMILGEYTFVFRNTKQTLFRMYELASTFVAA